MRSGEGTCGGAISFSVADSGGSGGTGNVSAAIAILGRLLVRARRRVRGVLRRAEVAAVASAIASAALRAGWRRRRLAAFEELLARSIAADCRESGGIGAAGTDRVGVPHARRLDRAEQIGRASCREREG